MLKGDFFYDYLQQKKKQLEQNKILCKTIKSKMKI